ncbi:MAG: UDP-N-acetylglucosamine 2-epimerase (non-hydrolyzing) [Rhodospirillaceae bacterium]|nr:UDP-N-acetylglucosamine 2-epimerase (non-hydrolyzing) [Rhodospirillaceae bacterium]
MSRNRRILVIVGTRPEAVKLAPLILALRNTNWADVEVLATGQHRELLVDALADFAIVADDNLYVMRPGQSLSGVAARILDAVDERLVARPPDCIVVQGDTTTVMAAGLAAFHRHIPVVHVEAGLRTGHLGEPFPEELNRRMVALCTALHCAPTEVMAANLRAEGIPESQIVVTGNTVIDALLTIAAGDPPLPPGIPEAERLILMTAHRRESFGAPLEGAFRTLRALIEADPGLAIAYPVHPNPNVQGAAHEILGNHPRVALLPPLRYPSIVALMRKAWLVLTDSGGLQEEAPALGKPVLVLRDRTERPEAIAAGSAQLVGTDPVRIRTAIERLKARPDLYADMAQPRFPYGDGKASQRIVQAMGRMLGVIPEQAADVVAMPAAKPAATPSAPARRQSAA